MAPPSDHICRFSIFWERAFLNLLPRIKIMHLLQLSNVIIASVQWWNQIKFKIFMYQYILPFEWLLSFTFWQWNVWFFESRRFGLQNTKPIYVQDDQYFDNMLDYWTKILQTNNTTFTNFSSEHIKKWICINKLVKIINKFRIIIT